MGGSGAVVVSGATGLVGRRLSAELIRRSHSVRALSRDAARAVSQLPAGARAFNWEAPGTLTPHTRVRLLSAVMQ